MTGVLTCTDCGFQASAGFAFCPRCGRRLSSPCPACGFTCEADFAFCPKCDLAKAQEVCERAGVEPDALMVLPFLC
jgi:hypothetical protein